MSHPWELTLRQFLDRIEQMRGVKLHEDSQAFLGPGGAVEIRWLEHEETGVKVVIPAIPKDAVMPLDVLESLVRQLDLPRDDFFLDPEPED